MPIMIGLFGVTLILYQKKLINIIANGEGGKFQEKVLNNRDIESQPELEQRLGHQIMEDSSPDSIQQAYDEFHSYLLKHGIRNSKPEGFLYKPRLSLFDRRLLNLIGKHKKVLEIGCGEGTLSLACAKNNNDVTGVDISKVAIQLAESQKGRLPIRFEVGDARQLPFTDKAFDVVVCKDVIEHLPQKELSKHLAQVYRVLKTGGSYIVYTPSKLLGDQSLGLHLSEYGIKDLTAILLRHHFKAEIICHWFYLLGIPVILKQRQLVSILMYYEKLLDKFRVGRLMAKCGNFSYAIVPTVWIRAVKI
jgi:ubiquinone/menaquinone biosynthesis C-methylase UbiE